MNSREAKVHEVWHRYVTGTYQEERPDRRTTRAQRKDMLVAMDMGATSIRNTVLAALANASANDDQLPLLTLHFLLLQFVFSLSI